MLNNVFNSTIALVASAFTPYCKRTTSQLDYIVKVDNGVCSVLSPDEAEAAIAAEQAGTIVPVVDITDFELRGVLGMPSTRHFSRKVVGVEVEDATAADPSGQQVKIWKKQFDEHGWDMANGTPMFENDEVMKEIAEAERERKLTGVWKRYMEKKKSRFTVFPYGKVEPENRHAVASVTVLNTETSKEILLLEHSQTSLSRPKLPRESHGFPFPVYSDGDTTQPSPAAQAAQPFAYCYHSTQTQTLPPLDYTTFKRIHGRTPAVREVGCAARGRFRPGDVDHYKVNYGPLEAVKSIQSKCPRVSTYTDSSFQTMDFKDSDPVLQQTKATNAAIAEKLNAVLAQHGAQATVKENTKIVHTTAVQSTAVVHNDGSVQFDGDVEAGHEHRLLPNLIIEEIEDVPFASAAPKPCTLGAPVPAYDPEQDLSLEGRKAFHRAVEEVEPTCFPEIGNARLKYAADMPYETDQNRFEVQYTNTVKGKRTSSISSKSSTPSSARSSASASTFASVSTSTSIEAPAITPCSKKPSFKASPTLKPSLPPNLSSETPSATSPFSSKRLAMTVAETALSNMTSVKTPSITSTTTPTSKISLSTTVSAMAPPATPSAAKPSAKGLRAINTSEIPASKKRKASEEPLASATKTFNEAHTQKRVRQDAPRSKTSVKKSSVVLQIPKVGLTTLSTESSLVVNDSGLRYGPGNPRFGPKKATTTEAVIPRKATPEVRQDPVPTLKRKAASDPWDDRRAAKVARQAPQVEGRPVRPVRERKNPLAKILERANRDNASRHHRE